MNQELKIALIALLALVIVIVIIIGATLISQQYQFMRFKNEVLGKTSAEVVELYGAFDNTGMPAGQDGLYRNTCCTYIVVEKRVGFLGTTPPKVYSVSFNHNGIAVDVAYETDPYFF